MLISHLNIFFGEVYVQIFCPFKKIIWFLFLSLKSFLYILDDSSLSETWQSQACCSVSQSPIYFNPNLGLRVQVNPEQDSDVPTDCKIFEDEMLHPHCCELEKMLSWVGKRQIIHSSSPRSWAQTWSDQHFLDRPSYLLSANCYSLRVHLCKPLLS